MTIQKVKMVVLGGFRDIAVRHAKGEFGPHLFSSLFQVKYH